MYTFYSLIVSLIVLEALVIKSDAVSSGSEEEGFVDDTMKIRTEMLRRSFQESGLKVTRGSSRSLLRPGATDKMIKIFRSHILEIDAESANTDPEGIIGPVNLGNCNKTGRIYFHFDNYTELTSLFKRFGPYARRIYLDYDGMDVDIRREINKNIVNKYAKNFTELYIYAAEEDTMIWEEISNKNAQFQFPNVKTFVFRGMWGRGKFDLNKIFPKLESVKIDGDIGDANCLANVKNLKKLGIYSDSAINPIQESQFESIFKKNSQLIKLSVEIGKIGTLQFIEQYLKNLKTLAIENADSRFLLGSNRVYNLASVTNLVLINYEETELKGFKSLKMPKLNGLKFYGIYTDREMFDFINHFGDLDTVQIKPDHIFYGAKYLGMLKNVKQYISAFYCGELSLLQDFFKNFDKKKSKLNSLKLICIGQTKPGEPEDRMKKINYELKKIKKPTWDVEVNVEYNRRFLIIERNS